MIDENTMMKNTRQFASCLVLLLSATTVHAQTPSTLSFDLYNTYSHDIKAYTQCLEFHQGILYESTGNGAGVGTGKKGVSSMRQTDFKTGKITKIHALPSSVFGEGCTILNNQLYQLTYQNNVAYRYNPSTLKINQTLPYFKKMEGWGLTNDGKSLYMSDGSDKIYQLDPKTFKAQRTISVKANGRAVPYINEMEWVNGKIYANVYTTTQVVVINPKTGQVEKVADLKPLQALVTNHPDLDVLNGIAYHPSRKTFFVTGKNWDKMFEIRFK